MSSSTRLLRIATLCRIALFALWFTLALLHTDDRALAYVPVFGGPEYDTATGTGYQTYALTDPFRSTNLVNNNGTAVATVYKIIPGNSQGGGRRVFQWNNTSAPPTEMAIPANYTVNRIDLWTYSINESGDAVGAAYNDALGERPVRWNSTGIATELGNLGTWPGSTFTWGQAYAINNLGAVVGYSERWVGSSFYDRAVRWNAGGTAPTELGELSHAVNGFSKSRAQAMNESGTAVGWAQQMNSGIIDLGHRAVRWDGSGTAATELGNLGGGHTNSEANDINESGTTVGWATKYVNGVNLGDRAVRWDTNSTAATELDYLGGPSSRAYAINDSGAAVGYSFTSGAAGHRALRWDASGTAAIQLGNLGVNGASDAYDINNSGTAVGQVEKFVDGVSIGDHAVAWRSNAVAIDLNHVIDPGNGWTLLQAYSISDTHWITGLGRFDPDGIGSLPAYNRYFTLQLPSPLPGDYNADFVVDAADYTYWCDHRGQALSLTGEKPDATTPGVVDDEDYAFWKFRFGDSIVTGSGSGMATAVPEPTSLSLVVLMTLQAASRLRRRVQ